MNKIIKHIVFFGLIFFTSVNIKAQFSWVQIGVDGLTCSACTRSVEMSIRKLDFVDSVSMNLENTLGKITFKKDKKVEIEKIAKAVTDAGFSLRSLYATLNMDKLKISNDFCWMYQNDNYHFIKIDKGIELKGITTLQFIGDKYMSKKEFKKWKMYCTNNCDPTMQLMPSSINYYVSLL